MKNLITLIAVLLISTGIISCTKKNDITQTKDLSIQGKWAIKKDSLTMSLGNSSHGVNYIGTPADYFDFRADNKLYTKEGTLLDTFTYKVTSDTTFTIDEIGNGQTNTIAQNGFIIASTSNNITVDFVPSLWNPGGNTTRLTTLQK